MKSKIKVSEKDLQREIIATLKRFPSIYWIRNNSISGKFIGRDGKIGWLNNSKKGSPDLVLCKNGLWLGIECKSTDGRVSPDQRQAEKDIERAGGKYFVVRTIQEFDKIIDCF